MSNETKKTLSETLSEKEVLEYRQLIDDLEMDCAQIRADFYFISGMCFVLGKNSPNSSVSQQEYITLSDLFRQIEWFVDDTTCKISIPNFKKILGTHSTLGTIMPNLAPNVTSHDTTSVFNAILYLHVALSEFDCVLIFSTANKMLRYHLSKFYTDFKKLVD